MRAVLDVDMLIALFDRAHVQHETATGWLSREIGHGSASCPITQDGCIRIMSQPAYPGVLPTAAVAERLAEATMAPEHRFWPTDVDLLASGVVQWDRILGRRQVTDAYLLALAVGDGGRFVTFDRRASLEAVPGGRERYLVRCP